MLCTQYCIPGLRTENLIVITPDDMDFVENLLLLTSILSLNQPFSTSYIKELSVQTLMGVTILNLEAKIEVVGLIPDA